MVSGELLSLFLRDGPQTLINVGLVCRQDNPVRPAAMTDYLLQEVARLYKRLPTRTIVDADAGMHAFVVACSDCPEAGLPSRVKHIEPDILIFDGEDFFL